MLVSAMEEHDCTARRAAGRRPSPIEQRNASWVPNVCSVASRTPASVVIAEIGRARSFIGEPEELPLRRGAHD
jgi:hypothetical protein